MHALASSSDGAPGLAGAVRRAQRGDEEGFEELMSLTQRRVAAVAYRMLGTSDEARDAAQEVYLRVHRFLHRFRADEDLNAWLYRLTVNVCHDMRRKRRPSVPLVEAPAQTEDAERATLLWERAALLRRALRELPEKERRALVLRDLEGLDTAEVARILGSSAGTVRSQICSARRRVHALLAGVLGRER
ncbi:MAG TPA: sigma-70 family RNA polymerase sigma factor [Thermoanaerobaculia bacterium]|nr:sigma-70 family RNA polymerase sigma factor [Thermoanaerobaculia bacterium]